MTCPSDIAAALARSLADGTLHPGLRRITAYKLYERAINEAVATASTVTPIVVPPIAFASPGGHATVKRLRDVTTAILRGYPSPPYNIVAAVTVVDGVGRVEITTSAAAPRE